MLVSATRIADVRQFNRFYTRQIGLLRGGVVGTAFSLTEGRVLYELGQRVRALPDVEAPAANALVVNSTLGVNSVAELVALLKREPGKYNFGSIGNGSLSHLAMEAIAIAIVGAKGARKNAITTEFAARCMIPSET